MFLVSALDCESKRSVMRMPHLQEVGDEHDAEDTPVDESSQVLVLLLGDDDGLGFLQTGRVRSSATFLHRETT